MFTGLVEGIGRVESLARGADGGAVLRIRTSWPASLARGASVAVDGVCLTVARRGRGFVEAVLSPETLARTTLGLRSRGEAVNLERPLRLGAPLGGHLVQGHVDGVGVVAAVVPEGGGTRVRIDFPADLGDGIVPKGSIAVDGVSLTVAALGAGWFEVALIPETLRVTRLGGWAPGTPVNLEADMIGRYVAAAMRARQGRPAAAAVTREFLAQHGFVGLHERKSEAAS